MKFQRFYFAKKETHINFKNLNGDENEPFTVIKLRECIDYKVHKVFPLRPCASGVDYPNGFAVGLGGPKDEQKQGISLSFFTKMT